MGDPKRLHDAWKTYKSGMAAEMIKQNKLNFNGGLGPALETLEKKWGTADGQKAAAKVKTVVATYRKYIQSANIANVGKGGTNGVTRTNDAWKQQKATGDKLLRDMETVATNHKIDPSKK